MDASTLIEGLVQAAPDAILVVRDDGRILLANAAAERLFGYTQSELLDAPIEMLLPVAKRALHLQHRARYTRAPRARPMGEGLELRARQKDGTEVPVEISLSPVSAHQQASDGEPQSALVTAFVRDISWRRAIRAHLHERDAQLSEERAAHEVARRLAAIVDASDDAVIAKELDGTVTAWNPGAERLYGYSAREMIGQRIHRLAPPERASEIPRLLERLGQGQRVTRFDTVRQRKDGSVVDVSLTLSPIQDEAGEVVGGAVIARDITDRLEALRIEQRMADQLRRLLLLATEMAGILGQADVAAVVLRQGIAALGAAAGNVVLLAEDGEWLDLVQSIDYPAELVEPWRRFKLTEPVARAEAVRTGTPVWLESPNAYATRYPHRADVVDSLPHPAHAAMPLIYQGKIIGGLALSFATQQAFAETDRTFLLTLAQIEPLRLLCSVELWCVWYMTQYWASASGIGAVREDGQDRG
jgi:PAS domain S-box-containing protein